MVFYIKDQDLLDLLDENGRSILTAAKINRMEKMLRSALIVVVIFGWPKSRTVKHDGQAADLQGRRARNGAPDIGRLCCGIC